jgi:hypothetical protein
MVTMVTKGAEEAQVLAALEGPRQTTVKYIIIA